MPRKHDDKPENPSEFGDPPAPELDVLSEKEKMHVQHGHTIAGAQQQVAEEGEEPTQVNEELSKRGEEGRHHRKS